MIQNAVELKRLIDILSKNEERYDIEKIVGSYEYAKSLHEGQFRVSGDPYISHPIAVAEIVAEQLLVGGVETICYNTVSGNAKALAVKCQVTVEQTQKQCYLALSKGARCVDYQLILNGDFLL